MSRCYRTGKLLCQKCLRQQSYSMFGLARNEPVDGQGLYLYGSVGWAGAGEIAFLLTILNHIVRLVRL
jgi:hypothetical protein